MNVDLGVITEGELQLVSSIIRFATVEEDRGVGVVVRCVNGRRTWQVGDDDQWSTITGEHHTFDGVYTIPGRLILGAAEFAENGTTCSLSIEDKVAIARSTNGLTLQLAISTKDPVIRTNDDLYTVEATMSVRELQKALSIATEFPLDIEDFSEMFKKPPTGEVTVERGLFTVTRSWSYMGCPDTNVKIPAKTKGKGSFSFKLFDLGAVMSRLFLPGDPEVTISFEPVAGRILRVSTDSLTIHMTRAPEGAATFYPVVVGWLKEFGNEFVEDDHGVIVIDYDDVKVRLQLFDGEDSILRATVTVLHGVKETPKLLRELNRLNLTRVGVRIWHDNNMVVVGTDEKCEGTSNIANILRILSREAKHLGGLLGPMHGGTPPAKAA